MAKAEAQSATAAQAEAAAKAQAAGKAKLAGLLERLPVAEAVAALLDHKLKGDFDSDLLGAMGAAARASILAAADKVKNGPVKGRVLAFLFFCRSLPRFMPFVPFLLLLDILVWYHLGHLEGRRS